MLTCSSTLDVNQTIPTLNMIALGIVILLSVGIPIYAFLVSKRQFLGRWQLLFFGATNFLVIEFFLTNLILFVPFLIPGFQNIPTKYPLLYSILCVLFVGAISEIGRYITLCIGLKEYPNIGTSAMFATGTASTHALILIAWNALQSLLICLTINQTGLQELVTAAGEEAEEMLTTLEPLFTVSWLTYLSSGIHVAANFVLHFSISMIFFAVIKNHAPSYLLGLAIGLRALYELPTYLYTYGILFPSAFVAELCVIAITVLIGYIGWTITHQYCAKDIENLHWDPYGGTPKKQAPFPKFNENIKK